MIFLLWFILILARAVPSSLRLHSHKLLSLRNARSSIGNAAFQKGQVQETKGAACVGSARKCSPPNIPFLTNHRPTCYSSRLFLSNFETGKLKAIGFHDRIDTRLRLAQLPLSCSFSKLPANYCMGMPDGQQNTTDCRWASVKAKAFTGSLPSLQDQGSYCWGWGRVCQCLGCIQRSYLLQRQWYYLLHRCLDLSPSCFGFALIKTSSFDSILLPHSCSLAVCVSKAWDFLVTQWCLLVRILLSYFR
jgi:hypothetical protein